MNYGENGINKKLTELNDRRLIDTIYLIMGVVFVCFVLSVTIRLGIRTFSDFFKFVSTIPNITTINFRQDGESTVIFDSSGNEIQSIFDSYADSSYVSAENISENAKNAFVAYYDPSFYEAGEVNIDGLFKELYSEFTGEYDEEYIKTGLKHDRSIAQRLLQNQFFYIKSDTSLLARLKDNIREQAWAIQLHQNVKKESVLEMYMNTLNFGGRTVGIQDAAKRYFDKDAIDLSASEAAVLIALSVNADDYDPIKNQSENDRIAKIVLKSMLTKGFITESQYEDYLGENVYQKISSNASKQRKVFMDVINYYVDATLKSVKNDLIDYNDLSQTQAYNAIFRGGLNIYSCEDSEIQRICESVLDNDEYYPKEIKYYLTYSLKCVDSTGNVMNYGIADLKNFVKNSKDKKITRYFKDKKKALKYIAMFEKHILKEGYEIEKSKVIVAKQPQSSLVLVDNATGKVRAVMGGRNQVYGDESINRAMGYLRQPGSVFSILSTYTPALDTVNLTLATTGKSSVVDVDENSVKKDENNLPKQKNVTMRNAIVNTDTGVASDFMEMVTPKTSYDYLCNLGITTLVDSGKNVFGYDVTDIDESLCQGTLINGISNMELTCAFSTLANNGVYSNPVFYNKVTANNSFELLKKTNTKTQILRGSTSWLITSALQDFIKKGEASEARDENNTMPVAGIFGYNSTKTDMWFEGYSPYVTCGVWLGNDDGTEIKEGNFAAKMWWEVMDQVIAYQHQKNEEFVRPSTIVEEKICTESGKRALENICDHEDSDTDVITEYFRTGTEPKEFCDKHVVYTFDKETGELATEETSEENKIQKVVTVDE